LNGRKCGKRGIWEECIVFEEVGKNEEIREGLKMWLENKIEFELELRKLWSRVKSGKMRAKCLIMRTDRC